MARKAANGSSETRGLSDILGLFLLGMSLLVFIALFSFDPGDLGFNQVPPNEHAHNWIGPVGAYIANALFLVAGAAAFLLPVLLLGLSLGCLFQPLAYLRRRWPWTLVLIVATAGALDLFAPAFPSWNDVLKENLNAPSAGGLLGLALNDYLFSRLFGRIGAATLYGTFYLIGLVGLTNFQLGDWLHRLWRFIARRRAAASPFSNKDLDRRARELARETERLEEEAARSGLGPDLKPVPEPTVRDLSIPQTASGRAAPSASKSIPEPSDIEGEVIPAREVASAAAPAAATTADILGRKPAPNPAAGAPPDAPHPVRPSSPPSPADAPASPDSSAKKPETAPPSPPPTAPKARSAPRKPKPIAVAAPPQIGNYQLPSLDLLNLPDLTARPTETKEELMANARLMQNTLAQFDIEVALGDITKGPTITRYELHPAPGVRLEKIVALSNNLAAALKAENVHILAPVPGKSSVGVEVPNAVKTKVIMRELLESKEWLETKNRIPLALGKDVYGHPIVADLAEMPHLLIAGSTGSGKSVCINAIISSLLYRFPPDQLRFVMIDPKVVELQHYNALPHLVVPVVTDPKKVILALRWVVSEMEKRYQIFARVGVRNIRSFNERPRHKPLPHAQPELPLSGRKERIEPTSDGFAVEVDEEIVVPRDEDIVIPDKLSYIVVIIDELADLMLVAPTDVEMAIARITQMARAAGIHCIVATQRPSVDVITGVIKANIPARIAFQVAAKVDSRTILDAMGADKLLGKGDMLYLPPGSSKLIRAQGALITDPEMQHIVEFITRQGKPSYEIEIHQQLARPLEDSSGDSRTDEDEELIQQCIDVIHSEQKASVSLLQRRLRLGYTRAARIMDELEDRGIVGPSKGAEPRDILIDLDIPDDPDLSPLDSPPAPTDPPPR
ncbi:MAG TPA: DNA translocase FtsK [Candidatus Paceibacterota bacterium]|nr:DNA translocase FtsK [Verrucomicrobiota bacterium]HRZ47280.1 DNA translocase FtsK [Candidatus Paceibacterota bacterium]